MCTSLTNDLCIAASSDRCVYCKNIKIFFREGLFAVEFLTMGSIVLYDAYMIIVCVIYSFFRTLYFLYMTKCTKIVLNNSTLIWFEKIIRNI